MVESTKNAPNSNLEDGPINELADVTKGEEETSALMVKDTEAAKDIMMNQVKANEVQESFRSASRMVASTVTQTSNLNKIYEYLPSKQVVAQMENSETKEAARQRIINYVVTTQAEFTNYRMSILDAFTKLYMMKVELAVICQALQENNFSDQVINGLVKVQADSLSKKLADVLALKAYFQQKAGDQGEMIKQAFEDLGISGKADLKGKIDTLDAANQRYEDKAAELGSKEAEQERILRDQHRKETVQNVLQEKIKAQIKSQSIILKDVVQKLETEHNLFREFEAKVQTEKIDYQEKQKEDYEEKTEEAKKEFDEIKNGGKEALQRAVDQKTKFKDDFQNEYDQKKVLQEELQKDANESQAKVQQAQKSAEEQNQIETKSQRNQANQEINSGRSLVNSTCPKREWTEKRSCGFLGWSSENVYHWEWDTGRHNIIKAEGNQKINQATTTLSNLDNAYAAIGAKFTPEKYRIASVRAESSNLLTKTNELYSLFSEIQKEILELETAKIEFEEHYSDFDAEKYQKIFQNVQKKNLEAYNTESDRKNEEQKTISYNEMFGLSSGACQALRQLMNSEIKAPLSFANNAEKIKWVDEAKAECENAVISSKENSTESQNTLKEEEGKQKVFLVEHETEKARLVQEVEKKKTDLEKAGEAVDAAKEEINLIEKDIPLKIKDLLICAQVISDTRANQSMSAAMYEVMPSTCDLVHQFFTTALRMVDTNDSIMPALYTSEECEDYREEVVNNVDVFYGDPSEEDEEVTNLQKLFRDDIFKAILKNKAHGQIAQNFIDEVLCFASLSGLNEDTTRKKDEREFFTDDYEKLATAAKAKLAKIATFAVKNELEKYRCSARAKTVRIAFTPAIKTGAGLPDPNEMRNAIVNQANEEVEQLKLAAAKAIEEKEQKDAAIEEYK